MNQKTKYITGIVLSVLVICALTIPAFALTESDVQSQVSASGKEGVAGNLFIWFLCAVAFLKISQKIDSFMASIGVNVGHTGGSMLGEAMVAFKGVSLAAGMAGKVVGNFADRASSRAGAAASVPPVVLLAAVEAAMQAEEEVPVAAAAAVTATPSCKAVWPVSSTAASITAHTETPPAQAAAALAAWRSVPP